VIFIFTILLIQTYIQINYYYDTNHANCTVITQYVKFALLSRCCMPNLLFLLWARGGNHSHDNVRQQRSQHMLIPINYYYDTNHANCTVITQYVKFALLSRCCMTNLLFLLWARGGNHSHDDVRQQRSQDMLHHPTQYTVHHVIPAYLVQVAVLQVV
jgi:hypothetical protein